MKTRSRTEIIGLILQTVVAEPLTLSKIMYQVMLSFKQTTAYASFLIERGLLSYMSQDKKYVITDKGRQFLALYNETDRLLTTPPPSGNYKQEEDAYFATHNPQMHKQYVGGVTIH